MLKRETLNEGWKSLLNNNYILKVVTLSYKQNQFIYFL